MKYNVYQCKNGLYDVAVPVFINSEHVGNFFTGQFLLEKPNVEYFREQAHQFNFDEQEYLKALYEVPVYTEIFVKKTMNFLVELTQIIGEMGVAHLKMLEQSEELRNHKKNLEKNAPRRSDLRVFEAVYHFNLYMYLSRFVTRFGGEVYPEFPTGNGKIDLIVNYAGKTYGIEVKSYVNIRLTF